MALLNWSRDYQLGHAVVDAEHRRLFDLINDFHYSFLTSRDLGEVRRLLNALVRYSETHFRNEEQLMAEAGYPDLERHKEIHAGLFETIFVLQEKLEAGAVKMESETVAFLRTWLTEHITEEDKAFGRFLAGQHESPDLIVNTAAVPPGLESTENPK
jgi:hemerythrin